MCSFCHADDTPKNMRVWPPQTGPRLQTRPPTHKAEKNLNNNNVAIAAADEFIFPPFCQGEFSVVCQVCCFYSNTWETRVLQSYFWILNFSKIHIAHRDPVIFWRMWRKAGLRPSRSPTRDFVSLFSGSQKIREKCIYCFLFGHDDIYKLKLEFEQIEQQRNLDQPPVKTQKCRRALL